MPRIPDFLLDCVIYLYSSRQAAESGMKAGGSGFLVSEPSSTPGAPATVYAVTNSHVIEKGFPVVRLNNKKGSIEVLPLGRHQWTHHPDGDDIAVCPVGLAAEHRYFALDRTRWFVTEAEMADLHVGPGDDVFFVGRFMSQQGRQGNTPTVRQGIISMLPREKVPSWDGTLIDSFLVEARSLSGYSGSPVFLNRQPGSPYHMEWDEDAPDPQQALRSAPGKRGVIGLLGIDCGHYPDFRPVLQSDKERAATPELWVEQNSGIMYVAPIWKLADLLHLEDLVKIRREREQAWVGKYGDAPIPDTAAEPSDRSEFQQFEHLARNLLAVPKDEADAQE